MMICWPTAGSMPTSIAHSSPRRSGTSPASLRDAVRVRRASGRLELPTPEEAPPDQGDADEQEPLDRVGQVRWLPPTTGVDLVRGEDHRRRVRLSGGLMRKV